MYYTGPSIRLRKLYEQIDLQTQTAKNPRSTDLLCQLLDQDKEVLASGSYNPSGTGTVHLVSALSVAKD